MPRPFAVIGITVFLVLAALFNASGGAVVAAFAAFTALLVISVAVKSTRRQRVFPAAFAGAALACLMLICANEFYYYPQLTLADGDHAVRAVITSEPETDYGNWYYEATASEIDGEKETVKLRLVFSSAPEIEPYDEIEGTFSFFSLGSTDESASSHKSENRFLGAYPLNGNYNITGNAGKTSPGYYILKFRKAVRSAIMGMLPNDYGALCTALVLGDRSGLSVSAYSALRKCGVTHIICVSGLHISLWSSAVLFVLRKLKIREKAACAMTIPVVLFLMLAAGMTYSVIRAGIMMLIYLLSIIISRQRDSLNSLGIALLVITAVNPFSAGNISLRLSALATMGIVLYAEYVQPKVREFFRKHEALGVFSGPVSVFLVTCAAVGFCLPVSAGYYGEFNFCVFPSNLLVVFAAEISMICSAAGAAVYALMPSVFNLPGFIAGFLAKYIIRITGILAEASYLNVTLSEKNAYILLCGVFAFCALAVLVAYTGKKVMPVSTVLVAGIVAVTAVFTGIDDYGKTKIRVFDTGNSTAVLVSYKGDNVLIGCGGDTFGSANDIIYGIEDAGGTLSALYIPENKSYCTSCLYSVAGSIETETVYAPGDVNLRGINAENGGEIPPSSTVGKIRVDYSADEKFFTVSTDDITFGVCCNPASYNGSGENIRLLITRMDYPENACFPALSLAVAEAGNTRGYSIQQSLINQGIHAAATAECGDIAITADRGSLSAERI